MKSRYAIALSILTALVATPLVAWIAAVYLENDGVTKLVASLPLPRSGSLDFALTQKEDPAAPMWAAPVVGGLGFALLFALISGVLFWWLARKYPWGRYISGFVLAISLTGYTWLAWDSPAPAPLEFGQWLPKAGVKRTPQALVREATRMPNSDQRNNDWLLPQITPAGDEPTPDWLREHAAEIRANWETLSPVREWVKKVNNYEGFDEYTEHFSDSFLDFKPFGKYSAASQQMSLLLAVEGRPEEALATAIECVEFGQKLIEGSRTLVCLMSGCVLEKQALKTVRLIRSRAGLSAVRLSAFIRRPKQQPDELYEFSRVILLEGALMEKSVFSKKDIYGGPWEWDTLWIQVLGPFLYKESTTILRLRYDRGVLSECVASGDLAKLEIREAQLQEEAKHLVLKNPMGNMLAHSALSFGGSKILKSLIELHKVYAEIFLEKTDTEVPAVRDDTRSTVTIEPKAG